MPHSRNYTVAEAREHYKLVHTYYIGHRNARQPEAAHDAGHHITEYRDLPVSCPATIYRSRSDARSQILFYHRVRTLNAPRSQLHTSYVMCVSYILAQCSTYGKRATPPPLSSLSISLCLRDRLNAGIHPRHHQMAPPSLSTK